VSEHRLEVADVFRQHGQEFLSRWGSVLSPEQEKAFRDIGACRTAALGTQVQQCDHCGQQQLAYRSCRNRNCPKCHSRTRDEWLRDRAAELLPVPYCHVVLTLPHELAPLALQNPRVIYNIYNILFRAASETLLEMAADPKRMGARIGILAVLHTWSQRLEHHPHVHCVVPSGGLSPDGKRWIQSRKKFFLPRKPLACLFRGKFLAYLTEAFRRGRLAFHGQLRELAHPACFQDLLECLYEKDWIIYIKPPFGDPHQVLRYLARYTHRVAISNGRLIALDNGRVHFHWRDSQHGNEVKEMSLEAVEFIRRFLLHVLPSGFVKIRHFGFLANRNRKKVIQQCRELLPPYALEPLAVPSREPLCPVCGVGHLHVMDWGRRPMPSRPPQQPVAALDSS
jgi:hypothetical protein